MGRRFDSFRARQCLEFSIYNSVTVAVAQLAESWIVIPVVVGSNPISHPIIRSCDNAKVAELVDALASGVSVLTDVGVQVPPLAPIIFTSFLVSSLFYHP